MISKLSSRAVVVLAIAVAAVILTGLALGIARPAGLTAATQQFLDDARNAGAARTRGVRGPATDHRCERYPTSFGAGRRRGDPGLPLGFLLAAGGTMGGALLSFGLSRSLFRNNLARQLARRPRLARFDALLARGGWRVVCLLRLSPIMPFAATSYALGMSSVGIEAYALGTVASLPALLGYVYIGTLARPGCQRGRRVQRLCNGPSWASAGWRPGF